MSKFVFGVLVMFFFFGESWGRIYRYQIGGKGGVPWEEIATKIAQYEKERATLEVKDSETKLVGYMRFPGSLEPLWTDSTINLARTVYERGGWVHYGIYPFAQKEVVDGKAKALENVYVMKAPSYAPRRITLRMNLGGLFRIASVRFYTRILKEGPDPSKFPEGYIFSSHYMQKYEIYVHDGDMRYGGPSAHYGTWFPLSNPGWKLVAKTDENRQSYVRIDLDPPRLAKYLWLESGPTTLAEVAEVEIYGKGYVPEAQYVTRVLSAGEMSGGEIDLASWGRIGWGGEYVHEEGAKLFIRTRTGQDETPYVYWRVTGSGREVPFWEDGKEVTKLEYYGKREHRFPDGRREKLDISERGKIDVDRENWSGWSASYGFEEGLMGTRITSPGPSRYIQLKVEFHPTMEDGGRIDSLWIEFSEPVARGGVFGELDRAEVDLGRDEELTYSVRGSFRVGDVGFDRLRVRTPFRAEVLGVWLEDTTGVVVDTGFVVGVGDKDFVVGLSDRVRDEGKVMRVRFRVPVMRYGVEFPGWVWAEGEEVVEQGVVGDLVVRCKLMGRGEVLKGASFERGILSPNGDGVGDVDSLGVELVQLTSPALVEVGVYELGGEMVRELHRGRLLNGRYGWEWDGKGDDGELVLPGVYLYRVRVQADAGVEEKVGTITVVY